MNSFPLPIKVVTKKKFFRAAFVFGFTTACPFLLYALDLPPEQNLEEASRVEKTVQRDAEKGMEEKRGLAEVEVEKPPEKKPGVPELRFYVSRINVEGNTAVASEELAPIVRPYENKEVTVRELTRLTRGIDAEYRKRGYITSSAYIPEQTIENNILRIRVTEGKVGKFFVDGNRYFRKRRLLAYSNIDKGEIMRYERLRKVIAQMNRNPDREVRAILRRGEEIETTDVVLKVKDRFPVHVGTLFDNQGTDSTGHERIGFTLRDSNFLALDDLLFGGTVFGRDFGAAFAQYLFPFPSVNARFIGGFSHAQVLPKRDIKGLAVNGISQTYTGRIEQYLYESERVSWEVEGGFDMKQSRTKLLSGTFRREQLRIPRLATTVRVEDRLGITELKNEVSWGVKLLGALVFEDPQSRQGVEPRFFRFRGSFLRLQKMPFKTRATLKVEYQLPSTQLPSSEALYLGGAASVRGYPEGDFLAESGFVYNFEYFIPCFLIPSHWQLPRSKIPLRKQVEFVLFYDQGYGRIRGPSEREHRARNDIGIGGGFRVQLTNKFSFRAEWGYGLGDEPLTEPENMRFNGRIQAEI